MNAPPSTPGSSRQGRPRPAPRRRRLARRRLSPRRARAIPGPRRLRRPQQGDPGNRVPEIDSGAARLVEPLGRAHGGRRHALLRLARLRPRDRAAARLRQVGGRRLARVRRLRPRRMGGSSALVGRQGRHDRHRRLRRRAVPRRETSSRRILPPSSRTTRAAPMARSAAFARTIPAACSTPSAICRTTSRERTAIRGRRASSRRSARGYGRRRSPIPTTGCTRISSMCSPARVSTCRAVFDLLVDPHEREGADAESEAALARIAVPAHTGAGWYGYTYKTHLSGAQNYFRALKGPKKLTLTGPSHPDRPLRALRTEMLRWYDHWLKGLDSGVMADPPVRYFVMGANEWRARRRLADPRDRLDQALSEQLGAAGSGAVHRRRATTSSRRPTPSCRCRRPRPTGSPAALPDRSAAATICSSPDRRCSSSLPRSTRTIPTGSSR